MTLAVVYTRASIGIQAPAVSVEVHISNGLPGFTLVGLPETTVKEARDRVRSALINSGFTFPAKRITVSLAPAGLPKEGGRFDLPIAIGILLASEQIPGDRVTELEFLAELALSGELRPVCGVIPAALAASQQNRALIIAKENSPEASLVAEGTQFIAAHLLEVCGYLHNELSLTATVPQEPCSPDESQGDLQDIIGQEQAKRALEVAAAGGHNLLLLGPPGTGKTMLASRLMTLLPPLNDQEALESAAIHTLLWQNDIGKNWRQRPFRAPHHSASMAALIGGGSLPRPGEVSLAHNGVLFLDELPEFERRVLDSLREPLESGEIIISRATAKVTFPAKVLLIAAMNPSPTGHYQGPINRTPPQQIMRYLNRLSAPFLDRFDLSIEVPMLPHGMLSQKRVSGENSAQVRERVLAAREKQMARCGKVNAELTSSEVEAFCTLTSEDASFLEDVLTRLGLSVRAWHRILKVALTLADLANESGIKRNHLAEALSYRCMDRFLLQLHKSLG